MCEQNLREGAKLNTVARNARRIVSFIIFAESISKIKLPSFRLITTENTDLTGIDFKSINRCFESE